MRLTALSLLSGLAVLVLGACTQTTYVAMDDDQKKLADEPGTGPDIGARHVSYDVGEGLYRDPPDCVTVLPLTLSDDMSADQALVIEEAVARHLASRVDRVIGPRARASHTSRLHVDLTNENDRRHYVQNLRCRHFMAVEPWGGDGIYVLFYAQERLGLHLKLLSADDKELWQARHVATRGDGSLPVSPWSAITGLFLAGQLRGDSDVRLSLVDDALRRMVATLPDFRYQAFKSPDALPSKTITVPVMDTADGSGQSKPIVTSLVESKRPTPSWMQRWTRGEEPAMMGKDQSTQASGTAPEQREMPTW